MSTMPYADITVFMDANLQDDIAVIDLFLDSYAQGHDIVYGVRSSREQDSWLSARLLSCFTGCSTAWAWKLYTTMRTAGCSPAGSFRTWPVSQRSISIFAA